MDINQSVIWPAVEGDGAWFQPRPCLLTDGRLAMTVQKISAADAYGTVHISYSEDRGKNWAVPKPVPSLSRQKISPRSEDGVWEEAVCDVVPGLMPDGRLLLIGQNVYYRNGVLASPNDNRKTCYTFLSVDGVWSERGVVNWDDSRASRSLYAGCAQRLVLDDGSVLLPVSHACDDNGPRGVTTLRLGVEGDSLTVLEAGRSLHLDVGRGLLEPTIVEHGGSIWMTIRAEDGRGWWSTSEDGLDWSGLTSWVFDGGGLIETDTTQQRWLEWGSGLWLVYTRKHPENEGVFRWRAPLYIAQFDMENRALIRATERRLLPASGEELHRLGNFHALSLSPTEAIVTASEGVPDFGWDGRTLLARIS
jgi:hypothetical protein